MLSSRARALAAAGVIAAGVLLGLAVTEIGLRLAGFEYRPFPIVQFGWPDPKAISEGYESDPELLWVTRDYHQVLQAGHRERPAVVFMGDSCTQFGTYPSKTLAVLAVQRPQLSHGVKVGVGGWTVVQGNWQLARDVLPMHPRVVTIYYGWNDHWIALGPPDADIRRSPILTWLSDHLRLVQLLAKVRAGLGGAESGRPNRVNLDTYEATLVGMVRQVHAAGAEAVVITAASNHVPGAEPQYLGVRHLRHLQDLIPEHQLYVEATRRAAAASGAVLCDSAAHFASLPGSHGQYFRRDGIHLTEVGDRELAGLLAPCIVKADENRGQLR